MQNLSGTATRRLIGLALIVIAGCLPSTAYAAPSLAEVQAKVRDLEEEATAAAEGAQEAKVMLATLQKQLAGIQAAEAVQGKTVDALSRSLGVIFSSDPSLYLSAAGSLEAITRSKSIQLRKFEAAKQRLTATSLTVNDKLALVTAAKKKFEAQSAKAAAKLKEAESILAKLKKEDRERLARLAQQEEDADQRRSLAQAKAAAGVSGRAGIALKYALKQIGDKYVFGAAGMQYWDCSGLTMRAFQAAGVSLPHSSAAQSRMGKSVSRSQLKPGDLVFFGRPVSHVGIYLGGGKMVHAPRTGSRVKVASASNLGRKPFVGARRF
jgi:cell wall-associated NlpC family hydrolase